MSQAGQRHYKTLACAITGRGRPGPIRIPAFQPDQQAIPVNACCSTLSSTAGRRVQMKKQEINRRKTRVRIREKKKSPQKT